MCPPLAQELVAGAPRADFRAPFPCLDIVLAVEQRGVLLARTAQPDSPVAIGRGRVVLELRHTLGRAQGGQIQRAQPRRAAGNDIVHGRPLGAAQDPVLIAIPGGNDGLHGLLHFGPSSVQPRRIGAHAVLAIGPQHGAARAVKRRYRTVIRRGLAVGQPAVGVLQREFGIPQIAGDGGKQVGVQLGVLQHVIAVAVHVIVGHVPFTETFEAAEVAVAVPEAGGTAQDGDLRTQTVEQPARQIRCIERVVKQTRPSLEFRETRDQIFGHGEGARPPVGILSSHGGGGPVAIPPQNFSAVKDPHF